MTGMLALTYSEFDNIVGPKLEYSYPPDVLSTDMFETLSDYAIVGSHLCKKSIIVKTEEIQFLSYSVAINKPKYFRNTLLFSCGVVLDIDEDVEPYEPLLRKLSSCLVALELEHEFLFKKIIKDEKLPKLLQNIFIQCKNKGEVFIEIDNANILGYKIFQPIVQPRHISEYEVPMLLYDKQLTSNLPWDITFNHILPQIDGIKFIKNIAINCDMNIDTVIKSVRILLYYKCIIMTDIFRFNNIYILYPDSARRLLNDPTLLEEIEEFSLVMPSINININDTGSSNSNSNSSSNSNNNSNSNNDSNSNSNSHSNNKSNNNSNSNSNRLRPRPRRRSTVL